MSADAVGTKYSANFPASNCIRDTRANMDAPDAMSLLVVDVSNFRTKLNVARRPAICVSTQADPSHARSPGLPRPQRRRRLLDPKLRTLLE